MKRPATPSPDPLDQLCHYISGAISSFFELLKSWRQRSAVPAVESPKAAEKPVKAGAKPSEKKGPTGVYHPAGEFPWERIVKIAQKLLAKDPTRSWRIGELAQAVKKAGANIVSATGLHFGLLPRLRKLGLISETGKGVFTGKKATASKPTATTAKPTKAAPPPAKKAATPFPWDTVISAARRLLKKDPSRRWSSSELCMAVKALAGLESGKGLHLTVPPRLKAEGLIIEKNGAFVAKAGAEKKAAPAKKNEKMATKVAVKGVEQTPEPAVSPAEAGETKSE